jgi:hypothetical protein
MAQFLPTFVVSVFVLRATHRAISWTVHRCLFIQAGVNAGRGTGNRPRLYEAKAWLSGFKNGWEVLG